MRGTMSRDRGGTERSSSDWSGARGWQRALCGGRGNDTAHRWLGIILGELLHPFGSFPASEQFDQLQRGIQARSDASARQPIAIVDEAGIAGGHDHLGEALREARQKLPVGGGLIAV